MTSGADSVFSLPTVLIAVAIALVFAAFTTWRKKGDAVSSFTTFALQAMVFEASLVFIAAFFYPPIFAFVARQPAFLSVVAMMTLIYSARDIVGASTRSRPNPARFETRR